MLLFSRLMILLCSFIAITQAVAQPKQSVTGHYTIGKIEGSRETYFKIWMLPEARDQQKLLLETDYVHRRIQEGVKIKLEGTVYQKHPGFVELSQVLFIVDTPSGPTPFWQLSRHTKALDLTNTPLMKLHAPTSDFTIF